jgi:CO dehydrogenase/acetyl-CoA synthase alpha subunit
LQKLGGKGKTSWYPWDTQLKEKVLRNVCWYILNRAVPQIDEFLSESESQIRIPVIDETKTQAINFKFTKSDMWEAFNKVWETIEHKNKPSFLPNKDQFGNMITQYRLGVKFIHQKLNELQEHFKMILCANSCSPCGACNRCKNL